MNIILEETVRTNSVKDVALKMMLAARTAPKACGIDNLAIALLEKPKIVEIADTLREMATKETQFFVRDADNILQAEVLFLIGTKIKPLGLSECSLCGFATCQEKSKHPNNPCSFNTGDLGIALGAAVSIAMDHRIDNRIMFSVGKAVIKLKILGDEIKICYGVPLSASGKNIFFDRKPIAAGLNDIK